MFVVAYVTLVTFSIVVLSPFGALVTTLALGFVAKRLTNVQKKMTRAMIFKLLLLLGATAGTIGPLVNVFNILKRDYREQRYYAVSRAYEQLTDEEELTKLRYSVQQINSCGFTCLYLLVLALIPFCKFHLI